MSAAENGPLIPAYVNASRLNSEPNAATTDLYFCGERLFVAKDDPALAQVIGRHSHCDAVAEHNADAKTTKFARQMRLNLCVRFGFNQEMSSRKNLFYYTFDLNQVVGRQINPRRECRLTLVRRMHNFHLRLPRAFPFLTP